MGSYFVCFLKYRNNKFDIIVNCSQHTAGLSLAAIIPKIGQIMMTAVNKELNCDRHVFQVCHID